MKKFIVSIIIIAVSGFILHATPETDTLFEKANKLYQQAEYESAIQLYSQIDSLGYKSADVYFNMANAFFRSNKLGKARLYYERALLISPSDEDIKANMEFLESMLSDRFDVVPEFFLKTWLRKIILGFHPDNWMIVSLIFFTIFLAGGMVYIFLRSAATRRIGFFVALISFLFSVSSYGLSYISYKKVSDPSTAVIMEASQVVKSAPRQSGKELFILHIGSKVYIENSIDTWKEIRISDGRKGWVPSESIEEI
ncbi:MAG: tetratricopeptide repeat protein [Bacteroidales bacterium]|nr:tetratricopeptide repeat protein [Bacteroidales bacterium]